MNGVQTYDQKVLATGPIAYWPQSEPGGNVAVNYGTLGVAANGTFSNVTLANDNTGPFGTPAPWYNGATSYCNIWSAALAAAYSGDELTLMAWAKADNWANGTEVVRISAKVVAPVDRVYMTKNNVANRIQWHDDATGVSKATAEGAQTTTDWRLLTLTVSRAADELKGYVNDAQIGATQNGLGAWGSPGVLHATTCCIGAQATTPAGSWLGHIGPVALWIRALPLAEIASLYAT